jgi:hypothetical protein
VVNTANAPTPTSPTYPSLTETEKLVKTFQAVRNPVGALLETAANGNQPPAPADPLAHGPLGTVGPKVGPKAAAPAPQPKPQPKPVVKPAPPKKAPCGCFAAGTLVTTADGLRPIESIREGELVLAWNEQTEELALQPVTATYELPASSLINLEVRGDQGNEEIRTSHPFWVSDYGWVSAVDLSADISLQTSATGLQPLSVDPTTRLARGPPETASVRVLRAEPLEIRGPVYNLTVADFNTYFVGSNAVLVHNKSPCPGGSSAGGGGAGGALPELKISRSKYPQLADNIENAQKAGHPNVLTHGGNARANRKAATSGVPQIKNTTRDEYPFASSKEGGAGSWVGHVPGSQNSAQGGLISNFVQKNNIKPGDKYRVVIVP